MDKPKKTAVINARVTPELKASIQFVAKLFDWSEARAIEEMLSSSIEEWRENAINHALKCGIDLDNL